MLLIDLQNKYPLSSFIINNIIKEYIRKVPEEMYKINEHGFSTIELCISDSFIDTIKILLNNGTNVNHQYDDASGWTIMHDSANLLNCGFTVGLNIVKLLIEYDANTNIKNEDGKDALDLCDDDGRDKVNKILENIASLNTKN